MRRLLVANMMSLDGFIAGPKGELDWFVQEGFLTETQYGEYARDLNRSMGAILLGRRTYEMFASYWPDATDNDPVITERMNSVPKIVFSRTLDKVGWGKWNNARLVKGDAGDEVRRLKNEPGKDLVLFGSGTLVSDLAKQGLIDEYQLVVHPVVLGDGIRQFKDIGGWLRLKLTNVRPMREGPVILYYQPSS